MKPPAKVLLVDDSTVSRLLLGHIIAGCDRLQVVDTAADGLEAVDKACSIRPDVILMDINMPHLDGLGATQRIMAQSPVPIVVMSATLQADTHEATFQALAAGALAFVPKPRSVRSDDFAALCQHLTTTLLETAEIPVGSHGPSPEASPQAVLPASLLASRKVCAMGLSTGGPPVLRAILGALRDGLRLPLLVAQHISPGFEDSLAHWLQMADGPRVVVARDGMIPVAGVCHLAPGGMDMTVRLDGTLQLAPTKSAPPAAPSIHSLFSSVREVYGRKAIAALMTGRGCDGADALLGLKNAGALTLVQQQEGCPAYDLPAAAVRLGAAQASLSPAGLARALTACN